MSNNEIQIVLILISCSQSIHGTFESNRVSIDRSIDNSFLESVDATERDEARISRQTEIAVHLISWAEKCSQKCSRRIC